MAALDPRVVLQLFAHDVRGALAGASDIVDTLRRGELPFEQRQFLLERVAGNLGRIQAVLTDVVDLERLDARAYQPQVVSLAEALHRAVDLVPEFDRLYIDCPPIQIAAEPRLLARALEKLLANAVGHTPFGTAIFVSGTSTPDGRVLIAVEDDGPGVPPDKRERIFEAFDRGDASDAVGGLGLGLALVRRIAEVHGGRAWVDDRPGGGASFCLELPHAIGDLRAVGGPGASTSSVAR